MSNPTVPAKNTGDQLSAAEVNSIVESIKTKYDGDDVPLPADNRRALAGGLRVTTGSVALAAGANDYGTADFTLNFEALGLDDYTPSPAQEFYATHTAGNNRLVIAIQTDGDWRLTFTDNGGTATSYDIEPTVAFVDGRVYNVAITFDRSGLATLYVNGSANGTVNISGESGVDIGSGNTNGRAYTPRGRAGGTLSANLLLALAEVTELHEDGLAAFVAAHPEYQWSVSDLISNGDFSDFTGTANDNTSDTFAGWTLDNGSNGSNYVDAITDSTPDGYSTAIEISRNGPTLSIYQIIDVSNVEGPVAVSFYAKHVSGDLGRYGMGTSLYGGQVIPVATIPNSGNWELVKLSFNATGLSTVYLELISGAASGSVNQFAGVASRGITAGYLMDEGNNYQAHDLSGRYDATLSEEGVSHIIPRDRGRIRVKSVDGSTTGFLIGDRVLLDPNTVVTAIIVDGSYYAVPDSVDQNLDYRQIRIQNAGGRLNVQRSDGFFHQDLTPDPYLDPASLSDFDLSLITQRTF